MADFNKKAKLVLLLQYLQKDSDEDHSLTTAELLKRLSDEGIVCDRKTLYSDMNCLTDLGYDIAREPTRNGGGWKLLSRDFELPELKLLVDAVQSSRFISASKSAELARKLGNLTSREQAKSLNRSVFVGSRVKSENEEILYNIDTIHRAIRENRQITFTYYAWNRKKELVVKGPETRQLSPWYLAWQDENYYLLAYDAEAEKIKHFRVDKMKQVRETEEKRLGASQMERLDLERYVNESFGMYHGEEDVLSIEFPDSLLGVIIDRFGRDVPIHPSREGFFTARCKVILNDLFYGYLAGLSSQVRILQPEKAAEGYRAFLEERLQHLKEQ
jgi:predicted DNA-binding transcriptional regulator YafY